jgi:hypothetical protein
MLPGETILTGAIRKCPECGAEFELKVMLSPAGYYIGTECQDGPNSRESGYYASRTEAEKDLPAFKAYLAGNGPRPEAARW